MRMENGEWPCGGRGDEGRAATQGRPYGVIGRDSGSEGAGGDGAPPLHVYRKSMQWANVGIGPYGVRGTGDEG